MSTTTLEQPTAETKKPLYRFRILYGRHAGLDPACLDEHGRLRKDVPEQHILYQAGDIITTEHDLLAGIDGNSKATRTEPKFERLHNDPIADLKRQIEAETNPMVSDPASPPPGTPAKPKWTVDVLNKRSFRELQQIAAEAKIDVRECTRKEELIRVLLVPTK